MNIRRTFPITFIVAVACALSACGGGPVTRNITICLVDQISYAGHNTYRVTDANDETYVVANKALGYDAEAIRATIEPGQGYTVDLEYGSFTEPAILYTARKKPGYERIEPCA